VALDSAVVRDNHAQHAGDGTEPCDYTASGDILAFVDVVSSKGGEFEERGARVDESGYAVSWQHLPTGDVFCASFLGAAEGYAGVEVAHLVDELRHASIVFLEACGGGVNGGRENGDLGGVMGRGIAGDAAKAL